MIILAGNHPSSLERTGKEYFKRYTLIAPLAPSSGGCKSSVYRALRTLTPLNRKFLTHARGVVPTTTALGMECYKFLIQ